ncbi:HlyD family efflux transporter periplasmic adaptor subunit [Marinilabiliaceae bacterium ANBcel2]|nr:HlyD family efflux transporter periplasmic adaptor subunit [Marinilabiliaceae bacterium ANBcel2]
MNKKLWQLVIPFALVVVSLIIYSIITGDVEEPDYVRVEEGTFEVVVSANGRLEALKSTQISIPDVLQERRIRIRHIEINDIVREGTVVERGDYIATLDPGDVQDRLDNAYETLERIENNLENAALDSSLVLSRARDNIRRAQDDVYDREIELEQSAYESEAVQRQAQIALETAERKLEQERRTYQQERRRHNTRIRRYQEQLDDHTSYIEMLEQLRRDLYITAPSNGLVVYARDHGGNKVRAGSNVSRWQPMIATLPDLSTLQSEVYIPEINISKIKSGLDVRIRIDAFPEETFSGVVSRVANVGQDMPGEFFSAFKVEIEVDPNGKMLLPGMSSSNRIVVESVEDALMVSRMAVFSSDECESFVYKREGMSVVKKEIKTGGENDNHYLIKEGLQKGDRVLLTPPSNAKELNVSRL